MFREILTVIFLFSSFSANATILSLGSSFGADTITRDTATKLDWLDVTVTRGLSYNQVTTQLGAGGTYDGYRYATVAELDQLIINFGYTAVKTSCSFTAVHCDSGIVGNDTLIENMINTLGDTYDAYADELDLTDDFAATGAGYTFGILGTQFIDTSGHDFAHIHDMERVNRETGAVGHDSGDFIFTAYTNRHDNSSGRYHGSFLVTPTSVPLPAAGWLFMSALVGLVGKKRLFRQKVG